MEHGIYYIFSVIPHQRKSDTRFQWMAFGDVTYWCTSNDKQFIVIIHLTVLLGDAHHILWLNSRRFKSEQLFYHAEILTYLIRLGTTSMATFVDSYMLALQVHQVKVKYCSHIFQRGIRQCTQGFVINRHRFIELADVN